MKTQKETQKPEKEVDGSLTKKELVEIVQKTNFPYKKNAKNLGVKELIQVLNDWKEVDGSSTSIWCEECEQYPKMNHGICWGCWSKKRDESKVEEQDDN